MVKIGVIGCGKIAQTRHLPEYATNPHAKLVGYYDKIRERSVQMAELYGGKVYETYYDMINDPEIDAVSICVENRNHAEITNAALYAGKHVLVEKPMAVTLAECESMVAAAEFNGKHLMVGHNMRFDPVHRRAKELLQAGVIGDIITFRTTIGNAGPEGWSPDRDAWFFDKDKAAMGALSDLGIHKLDLMQYLTGQTVIETTAKVMTLNKHDDHGNFIGVDDNALCILRMNGGAVGTLAASWTVYGKECNSTCHRRVCGRPGARSGAGDRRQEGADHHEHRLCQHQVLRNQPHRSCEQLLCHTPVRYACKNRILSCRGADNTVRPFFGIH